MSAIYHEAVVDVPAPVAWDFLSRYARAEVHVFSSCVAERLEGDYRVVTLADGTEVPERNVTVDAALMRAVYTVPGLLGAEHHQAEMRVIDGGDGTALLSWTTDVAPDAIADHLREAYGVLFAELVGAVNAHTAELSA